VWASVRLAWLGLVPGKKSNGHAGENSNGPDRNRGIAGNPCRKRRYDKKPRTRQTPAAANLLPRINVFRCRERRGMFTDRNMLPPGNVSNPAGNLHLP
jgi:hypothetical protein